MDTDWPLVCRLLGFAMVGRFVQVCRGRGLNVKAGKSRVIVLDGEEGLEC